VSPTSGKTALSFWIKSSLKFEQSSVWLDFLLGHRQQDTQYRERNILLYRRENAAGERANDYWLVGAITVRSLTGKSPIIAGRYISEKPDLNAALAWIESCSTTHECCPRIRDRELPTRLIDVGQDGDNQVRMVETKGTSGKYITLSHCWGGSQPVVTNPTTYRSHLNGIRLDTLPLLFRDAVIVVRRLGFQYLWIDSLCIIQGDQGDWDVECSKMGAVYSNAVCTIANPYATSSAGSLLHSRQSQSFQPIFLPGCQEGDIVIDVADTLNQCTISPNSPLGRRAWIMQERLLTPHVLTCSTEQMCLECNTDQCANTASQCTKCSKRSILNITQYSSETTGRT
jgi:hypothetical protein